MRLLVALVVSAGVFPAVVSAQPAPTAASSPGPLPDRPLPPPPHVVPPPAPRRLPVFSATITPFALPWEIFELTVPGGFPIVALSFELRAHPRLGIAVMGLGGEQTNSDINFKRHDTFFEWGVEPRCYLLGGFRGLMVGAELHRFRMHTHQTYVRDASAFLQLDFAGYTYGPFFGYKFTTDVGFTFEVKVGFEAINWTMSDQGHHPDVLPITDAKVGWSF